MTPLELRNSILALAFQGKLVAQNASDSEVEQIIYACKEDKKQAIFEGKYRNEKFRGAINEHEYNIPDTWRVLYISDMALFQEGPGILAVDFRTTGTPLIRISGMQTQRVSLDGCNFLDPIMVENKWKHFKLDMGDILISTSASMDKVCEVFEDCVGAIPYTGQIRFKMYGGILKEYFKWFVKSPFYIKQINNQQAGAAIKHYGPTHLRKMTIPIAPLEEQKRIVAKIEELLPYIDRYEEAWKKLEIFNERFPEDMQKSLLQYAIQGKLVEQREEEGTGEELYRQIQKKREELIKESKIKKKKSLPEITKEEVSFDIPESWRWTRWGNVINIVSARRVHQSDWKSQGVPFYRAREIAKLAENGFVDNELFISQELFDEFSKTGVPKPGDLMVTAVGTLGKTYIVKPDDHFYYKDASVICFENYGNILSKFLRYVMQSEMMMSQIRSNSDGTTVATLTMVRMAEYIFPLPPLAEQKRIVAKLDELLPLCDRLK